MNCVLSRVWRNSLITYQHFPKMTSLPPRKASSSSNVSKQNATPLRILLQMGFPKHRALKALAATGNRSVQLASDWLLTHVNDAFIDAEEPREYILYASPVGALLAQLLEFWDRSKAMCGWTGAHNFPPHITLVSFFKAPDDTSLQLAKCLKQAVENVGDPPACPLKLEPYVSHNFMGLFVSEEHADYLKRIAVQYVKQVSSVLGVLVDTYEHLNALGTCFPWCAMQQEKPIKSAVSLEAHVKSLHITLAYHFEVRAFDALQGLVAGLQPCDSPGWELRLYSRDPRFANHQVYKVVQSYEAKAGDELELVLGDYIYIEQKDLDGSPDGWVHGTSWLTGVSGFLPAVYTRRTAESDAWTLHRAMSLSNNNSMENKSESGSNTEPEVAPASVPAPAHEDAHQLGRDKSEEIYNEWGQYWDQVRTQQKHTGYMDFKQGIPDDWSTNQANTNGKTECKSESKKLKKSEAEPTQRWYFALRHGERIDLTYGQWTPFCFDEHGKYVRKDLNMPITLPERAGGVESYSRDTPLTRVGRLQAFLVGEALRLAGVPVRHVYASAALRCVETAHEFTLGLGDPSVKVRVDSGLFEYKLWHAAKGLAPFMTPQELHKAGYNVDVNYKPYVELDIHTPETLEEFYERNEKVMQSAVKDTEAQGGNIMFVGHAATLDMMVVALSRLDPARAASRTPYQVSNNLLRVPYCGLAAMRDRPWALVPPPCPPAINSSSGRFDWKILHDVPI